MSNEETKERFHTLPDNAQTTIETVEASKVQNDINAYIDKNKKKKKKKKLTELELETENNVAKTNYKTYFSPYNSS